MITEDLLVPQDNSWLGIPTISGNVILFNGTNQVLLVRLGATSTSYGMRLHPEQTMMFDETVYVKPVIDGTKNFGSLRVTR